MASKLVTILSQVLGDCRKCARGRSSSPDSLVDALKWTDKFSTLGWPTSAPQVGDQFEQFAKVLSLRVTTKLFTNDLLAMGDPSIVESDAKKSSKPIDIATLAGELSVPSICRRTTGDSSISKTTKVSQVEAVMPAAQHHQMVKTITSKLGITITEWDNISGLSLAQLVKSILIPTATA